MPTERRSEPGEVHPQFWARTVTEAFKNDPLRIIIELVKNAADSYTRLKKKKKVKPPFKIYVKITCKRKNPPDIAILDLAEGMDANKLKEALIYGTQTSRGEDIEAMTSAEKGIGLKDAMMALEDNWLITIKNGFINERNKHPDFMTGIGKENAVPTKAQREKWGIPANGTVVFGRLPEYFQQPRFATICDRLKEHFLLRKLLQNQEYEVYVINERTKEENILEYTPPTIKEQKLQDRFKILYNGKEYGVHMIVNKSTKELPQGKPYGKSGLLFYYGEYSVLDFSLGKFDKDLSFSKFFGEVRLKVEKLVRNPPNEAPLVDEKRRSLDRAHPFNKKLFIEVNKRLEDIREEEEKSMYSVDSRTKKMILQELNKIYDDLKGRGGPPKPPIQPETYAFHPVHVALKEYESKRIHLVINSQVFTDELQVKIECSNPDIHVKQSLLKIKKDDGQDEFIVKPIELYSERAGSSGELSAVSDEVGDKTQAYIEVKANPIFTPMNGFAFVPENTTIVDGGQKKVSLYMDRNIITASKEITLNSQDPINAPGKWILPNTKNLDKYVLRNVVKIEIPIKVLGSNHIGEKATISAAYLDRKTKLHITVVSTPMLKGLITNIELSSKKTIWISSYGDGILYLYIDHPLCKKYMLRKKDFRIHPDFQTFIADTLTRQFIKACVDVGIEENLSRFRILDMDNPEPEKEWHYANEYYEHGRKMQKLFMRLARSLKVGK